MSTTTFDVVKNRDGSIHTTKYRILFMLSFALLIALALLAANSTVSFAQTATCNTDMQGTDDEPGQKDLTEMCVSPISGGILPISWQWDDTSWSGKNTGDACSLYDTDGDGLANYSLCVTVSGSPATQTADSPRLYSCGDTSAFKCTSPVLVSPNSSTCTVTTTGDDPFDNSDDTLSSCSVNLNDIGNPATVKLLDVCSYPSQNPQSDPSDCINYSTAGSAIIVNKVVDPATDPGLFNLQVLATSTNLVIGQASDVGNGGTTGRVLVDSNTGYTIQETAGTDTLLSNYTSTYSCVDDSGNIVVAESTGTSLSISRVGNNVDVTCTITNRQKAGT